jgi:isochorismate pyruvate lyase
MTDPVSADRCTTMAEVRHAIDTLDRRIVALLGERMRFIEAAARIKQDRDAVRDEARKADVIAKACAAAAEHDFPEELAAAVYEVLVEGSIAHEMARFDGIRQRS